MKKLEEQGTPDIKSINEASKKKSALIGFILINWEMLFELLKICPQGHHLLVGIQLDSNTPIFYFKKSMSEYQYPNIMVFHPEADGRRKGVVKFFEELYKHFGGNLTLTEFKEKYWK